MRYIYKLETGVTKVKSKAKKYVAGTFAGLALAGSVAMPALAAKPVSPGCFGRDRAAYAQENGSLGSNIGGVGYYASMRAGENGTINQEYKDNCGGSQTN